ncbi:acetyltransferase [Kordiimonas marina]|uniref:acetyltransferase n=1 Tax=Kordiimonas marina TaxID=2872312 RepID=UPI001FF1A76F|nr:acetyltransferase [Kordiimonas marina]MCJ9430777.1 acetyltransferase [Kordiimonas marina]
MAGTILLGLYGAGGFGREVMPIALDCGAQLKADNPGADVKVCFIETEPQRSEVNGLPVLSEADFLASPQDRKLFNIAFADSKAREVIAERCIAGGAEGYTLTAANATVYGHNEIGEGAILCAYSHVTSNAKIGRFFHANIYSYVAHDCRIGDFVTFAPSVHCNGNVHIHDHAYIGTGAIIKQGSGEKPLIIGEGAIVGMGAVVTKDVPPHTTVIGNPARPFVKS